MAAIFPGFIAIGDAPFAAMLASVWVGGRFFWLALFRMRLPPGIAAGIRTKSLGPAVLALPDGLFALLAKPTGFADDFGIHRRDFYRPVEVASFAIAFDGVNAEQEFSGDRFISEAL